MVFLQFIVSSLFILRTCSCSCTAVNLLTVIPGHIIVHKCHLYAFSFMCATGMKVSWLLMFCFRLFREAFWLVLERPGLAMTCMSRKRMADDLRNLDYNLLRSKCVIRSGMMKIGRLGIFWDCWPAIKLVQGECLTRKTACAKVVQSSTCRQLVPNW